MANMKQCEDANMEAVIEGSSFYQLVIFLGMKCNASGIEASKLEDMLDRLRTEHIYIDDIDNVKNINVENFNKVFWPDKTANQGKSGVSKFLCLGCKVPITDVKEISFIQASPALVHRVFAWHDSGDLKQDFRNKDKNFISVIEDWKQNPNERYLRLSFYYNVSGMFMKLIFITLSEDIDNFIKEFKKSDELMQKVRDCLERNANENEKYPLNLNFEDLENYKQKDEALLVFLNSKLGKAPPQKIDRELIEVRINIQKLINKIKLNGQNVSFLRVPTVADNPLKYPYCPLKFDKWGKTVDYLSGCWGFREAVFDYKVIEYVDLSPEEVKLVKRYNQSCDTENEGKIIICLRKLGDVKRNINDEKEDEKEKGKKENITKNLLKDLILTQKIPEKCS